MAATVQVAKPSSAAEADSRTAPVTRPRRQATVYDAVAGRVSSHQFIRDEQQFSTHRDTASRSRVAVPPEEVLFRRKQAPVRYAEHDIYFSDPTHDPSPLTQLLPDSDLLKAIHGYSSDYYSRCTAQGGRKPAYRKFDETALLAAGVLLEVAAGQVLGASGDKALVEGENEGADAGFPTHWSGVHMGKRSVIERDRKRFAKKRRRGRALARLTSGDDSTHSADLGNDGVSTGSEEHSINVEMDSTTTEA